MELDDRLKPRVRLDTLSTQPSPQAAIYTIIRPIIKLDGKRGGARLGKTERLKNKRDTSGNSFAKKLHNHKVHLHFSDLIWILL